MSLSIDFPKVAAKGQSERALDALTFFRADVADGLGPFLVIYLTASHGWSAGDAGWAMAAMLLGTVVSQAFTGAWIDRTYAKRELIVAAAATVAICCLGMYYFPTRATIFALQFIAGVAVTVFPPAIAATSLGLVGRTGIAARIGRNEGFNHAGNVAAAGLAAATVWFTGSGGAFYAVAAMAIASAIAAINIRANDIDHALARGADGSESKQTVVTLRQLFSDHRILWFTAAVVLFHFANAAMLPLVGQKVAAKNADSSATLMAACIVVAQLVMVPVALLASRYVETWGRRNVFIIGFAVLPVRGMLYTCTDDSRLLIANQMLDGIGAGIFGVTAVLIASDLTRGTGRFNFLQGVVATAVGLGAAASNVLTGQIVDGQGFNAGFLFLASVAVLALGVFYCCVPETRDANSTIFQRSQ